MQKRRREFGRWAAASALVAAVGFYYRVTWGDLSGFLGAIVNQPVELDTLFDRYLPLLALGALAVIRNKWFHMVGASVALLSVLSMIPN